MSAAPTPKGVVINFRLLAGVLSGAAAAAWAAIGITYAVSPDGGRVDGNYIGAGHLVLLVNHSTQQRGISAAGLVPGQQRDTDQLVAADMGGVSSAALTIAISGARSSDSFAHHSYLRIGSSDPALVGDIAHSGDTCTAPGGYVHEHSGPIPSATSPALNFALGNLTPGYGICVRFQVGLDSGAGNDLQIKASDVRFTYHLEQTA